MATGARVTPIIEIPPPPLTEKPLETPECGPLDFEVPRHPPQT